MKHFRWLYVGAVTLIVAFCAVIVFFCMYYSDYAHFGEEIECYLDSQYASKNDLKVSIDYGDKRYYIRPEDAWEITEVMLRGDLLSRIRVFFETEKKYKDREHLTVHYNCADLTIYDITEGDDEAAFLVYDDKKDGVKYYKLEGISAFKHAKACIKLIKK